MQLLCEGLKPLLSETLSKNFDEQCHITAPRPQLAQLPPTQGDPPSFPPSNDP